MKKISVIGSPGAGKSTFAKGLSNAIGIKVYHLDRLFWKPGWVHITREELMEKVNLVFEEDEWIIDGNYQNTLESRFEESDTIFFLDYSLIICLWGIFKRRFEFRNKKREDITEGCHEKLDFEFFWYVVMFRLKQRPMIYEHLNEYRENRKIILFKNIKQARNYIENMVN